MRIAVRGIDDAEGNVAGAAGDVERLPAARRGGLSQATIASFHRRCRPPDMMSFIRS